MFGTIDAMKEYYVYILRCKDGSYYTGVTNDWERRLGEHQSGVDPTSYTFQRRPVQLVHLEIFSEVTDAIRREKQIQGWNRRKKEILIQEYWEQLPKVSRRKGVWLHEVVMSGKNAIKRVMLRCSEGASKHGHV